jgi:hypothetical protein
MSYHDPRRAARRQSQLRWKELQGILLWFVLVPLLVLMGILAMVFWNEIMIYLDTRLNMGWFVQLIRAFNGQPAE